MNFRFWFALTIWLYGGCFYALAEPMSADELPSSFLDACDAGVKELKNADRMIKRAAQDLIDTRIFSDDDFATVKLGFCGLRSAGGPAATTTCENDIVLFDEGYKQRGEILALTLTMAHEMKHVRQHRAMRAKAGADYCTSDRYERDKPAMEMRADAFGNAIIDLFFGKRAEGANAE